MARRDGCSVVRPHAAATRQKMRTMDLGIVAAQDSERPRYRRWRLEGQPDAKLHRPRRVDGRRHHEVGRSPVAGWIAEVDTVGQVIELPEQPDLCPPQSPEILNPAVEEDELFAI